jgi:propanol-preferring alcohol dehydrogenase
MMKATVVTDFARPLQIKQVPVPVPGPGQALVRIEASGVCHTDIHAAHGDWPVKPPLPFIPGHEGVGVIEVLGPVDLDEGKLELARELGAEHVVNAAEHNPAELIRAQGGADVAIALAASPQSFHQAFASLRRGGRLVCVALPGGGTLTVPIFDTVLGGISVIGSIVGTRQDLAEVFELHRAGRTRVFAESRKLEQVNETFSDVLAGRVQARIVFEF